MIFGLTRVRMARVLAVLAVIAVAAAAWFLLLSPRASQVDQLTADREAAEFSNITLLREQRQLMDLAAQAPALAREAQDLFAAMPQTANLPEVLDGISRAAVASGIDPADISVINTGVPEPVTTDSQTAGEAEGIGVNLATMHTELSVTGSVKSLKSFLERIQTMDRSILVDSTVLTAPPPGTNKGKSTLTVTGTMFVLQSTLPNLVANAQKVVDDARAQARSSTISN